MDDDDEDDDQFDDDDANGGRKVRSISGSRRIVSREGVSNMTIPEDEEVAPPMSPYEVERSYQVPQELGGVQPFEVGQLALALFDDATTWWPCMVMGATDLGDDVAQEAARKAASDHGENSSSGDQEDEQGGGVLSPLQAAAAVRARWTYELEYFDGDRRVDVPATEVEPMPAAEAAKHLEALAAAAEKDDLDAAAREAEAEAAAAREALEEAQRKSRMGKGKGRGGGQGGSGSGGRNPVGRGEGPRRRAGQGRVSSSDAVTAAGEDEDDSDLLASGASVLSAGRVPSGESLAPTPATGQLPVEADAGLAQGDLPTTQRLQDLMAAANADNPVAGEEQSGPSAAVGGKGLTLDALAAKKSSATLEREALEVARQERLDARAAAEARESEELAARKAKRAEERALMAERFRRAEEIAEKRKRDEEQQRKAAADDEKAAAARDAAANENLPASVRREQEKARAESLAKSAASRLEEKMRADRLAAKQARELAAQKEKEEAEAKERALEEERQAAARAAARAEKEAEEARVRQEAEAKEQEEEAQRRQQEAEEAAAAAAAAVEEQRQREEEEQARLMKQREEEAAELARQQQQHKEEEIEAAAAREALLMEQREEEEEASHAAQHQQEEEDEGEGNIDAEIEKAALHVEAGIEPATQDFAPIHLQQNSLNTLDSSVHRSLTPDSARSSLTPDRHGLSADRRASTSPSHISSLLEDYNSTLSAVTEDPYSSAVPPSTSTFAAKTGTTVEASTLPRAFPAGAETLAAATARGTTANATTTTNAGEDETSGTYTEPPSSETVAAATEQSAEADASDSSSSSAMASESVDVPSSSDLLPVTSMASPDGFTRAVEDSTSATLESSVEEPSAVADATTENISNTEGANEETGEELAKDASVAAPPVAPVSPAPASGASNAEHESSSSSMSTGQGRPPLLPTPSKASLASSAMATAPPSAGRAPSVDRIQSASLSLGRPHSRTPQRASQSPGRLAYAHNAANLSPEAAAVDPVAQAMLAYRRLSARSPAVVRRSSDDLVAPYSNHHDRTPSTGRSRSVGTGSHLNPEIIFTADPRRRGEPMPSPGMRDDDINDGVSRTLYPATTSGSNSAVVSSIARSLSAPRAGGPSTSPVPEDQAAEAAASALNEEDGDDDNNRLPEHDNGIALPPGWSAVATDDGATYYWHSGTNEVTWDMPGEEAAAARKAAKEAKKAAKAAAKAEKKRKQEQEQSSTEQEFTEEPTSPPQEQPSLEPFQQRRARQATQRESPPGSDDDDDDEVEPDNSSHAAMQRIAEVEDESTAEGSQASPPASPGQAAAAARATAAAAAASSSSSSSSPSRLEENSGEVSGRLELETSQDHSQLSGAPNPLEETYSTTEGVVPPAEEETAPNEEDEQGSEQWDPQGSSTIAEHGISMRHSPVDDYEGSSEEALHDADGRADVEGTHGDPERELEAEHGVDVTGQSLEVHADWEPNERPPPLSANSQAPSEEPMSPLGYEGTASGHFSEEAYDRRDDDEDDGGGEGEYYEGEEDEEGFLDGIEGEDFSEGPYLDDGDEESQIALSTVDEGDEDYSQAGSIDSRDPRGGSADLHLDGEGGGVGGEEEGGGGVVGEDGELLDEDARMAADQMVDFLAHAGLEDFVDVFMHFGFASVEDLLNPDLVGGGNFTAVERHCCIGKLLYLIMDLSLFPVCMQ